MPFLQLNAEGLNGQQANADLVGMVAAAAHNLNIPVTLHDRPLPYSEIHRIYSNDITLEHYLGTLATIGTYMKHQALGIPIGSHSLFSR
jgi:hypothetical protein